MPISPTNQVKNSISPQNSVRNGFFMKMEDGFYLLQEIGDKIILDLSDYGVIGTNQPKSPNPSIWSSLTLPWSETAPWLLTTGILAGTNQIKS